MRVERLFKALGKKINKKIFFLGEGKRKKKFRPSFSQPFDEELHEIEFICLRSMASIQFLFFFSRHKSAEPTIVFKGKKYRIMVLKIGPFGPDFFSSYSRYRHDLH